MALNSSGPISLGGSTAGQSINLENGFSATAQVSLNDTAVRNLAGVASGAITMPTNFYGKSNSVNISYTFSANTANASLNLSSISGYVAGKSNITVTINSGIYLYATSTGGYGLNLSGGTSGDTLTIVNNGYIMGQGGNGSSGAGGATPGAGGAALNLGFALSSCTINNTNASAYIGGGGGGGAGGMAPYGGGGGGAGGGNGGSSNYGSGSPGSGGGIGSSGSNATSPGFNEGGKGGGAGGGGGGEYTYYSGKNLYTIPGNGGGGGRIFPGTGGAGGTAGGPSGVNGGAGGSANSAGSGAPGGYTGSGGGGWGASGGTGNGRSGGAGGKAVNLNAKSVTWTSGNTTRVYGAVS